MVGVVMAKYVFLYGGGQMGATDAEREALTQKWMAWFGTLGSAVLDGGNPFGGRKAVSSRGVGDSSSDVGGYSLIQAGSLDAAAQLAKGCPVLQNGGRVDVLEALDM
jgi:hypothetical protein